MSVSQDEFLEQIQSDRQEFQGYSAEVRDALRVQVKILRRSYRTERPTAKFATAE